MTTTSLLSDDSDQVKEGDKLTKVYLVILC